MPRSNEVLQSLENIPKKVMELISRILMGENQKNSGPVRPTLINGDYEAGTSVPNDMVGETREQMEKGLDKALKPVR